MGGGAAASPPTFCVADARTCFPTRWLLGTLSETAAVGHLVRLLKDLVAEDWSKFGHGVLQNGGGLGPIAEPFLPPRLGEGVRRLRAWLGGHLGDF